MKSKRLKWFALPLVALSLTACGGEVAGGNTNSIDETESSIAITDPQGSVEGYVGASDDATVQRCEASGQEWVSAGIVTNPTDTVQNYRIYVAFNKNRDTKGLVQVDIAEVAPNTTAEWEASTPVNAENLECLLRVERFTQ